MGMNPFDITGRVIVITGGSGFLGSQYTKALTEAGAVVVNFDVDTGVDVTDEASVEKAVEKVVREYGKIDGLITNAAANPKADEISSTQNVRDPWAPYSEFSADLFRSELDLNLAGSFIPAKYVAKHMIEARSGSIVFIASDLALIAPTNSLYAEGKCKDIAYGTSKAGVLGLMRFFAAYLGAYGVRANALVPGGMFRNHDADFAAKAGALSMLGRMATEGEFNGSIQFLLSDASSYMTGACMVVDGGRTAI